MTNYVTRVIQFNELYNWRAGKLASDKVRPVTARCIGLAKYQAFISYQEHTNALRVQ